MESPALQLSMISSNLRPEEAYVQILDSLQQLDKVSTDVFDKIDARSKEQQLRLKSVTSRISAAEAKVNFLRGSKKAIRVFAAATFPANDTPNEYQAIFSSDNSSHSTQDAIKSDVKIRARFPRDVKPPQKLEVLPLVAVKDPGLHFDEPMHGEGLGEIPSGIKSVSSLLLFNTAQNPYTKFVSMDPLGGWGKTRKLPEAAPQTPSLDAAPASFAGGEELSKKPDDLSYIPGFGAVPEFDLPNMLPDLPGVFEDSSFGDFDAGFGIAVPSMDSFTLDPPTISKPIAQLPVIIPPPPTPNLPVISLTGPAAPPRPPPAPPSGQNIIIPSPPPPPPGMPMSPPPPPPPVTKSPAQSSPDARSSLLESIRAAGGAEGGRLKSVKEKKQEQKKKKQEEKTKAVSSDGGDLMGDLKNRLANLRKGISKGSRAGDSDSTLSTRPAAGFGSAMDQVSKLIPHAGTIGPTSTAQDNEEDWN